MIIFKKQAGQGQQEFLATCSGPEMRSRLQVEEWNREQIVRFWQRWYFPANTTLYLVGDFGQSVEDCRTLIERCFGSVPAVRDGHELTPYVFGRPPNALNGGNGTTATAPEAPLKQRHEVSLSFSFFRLSSCSWTPGPDVC